MNIHHYLGNVAGAVIGFGLGALLYAFRRRLWARRAHRLARRSDITLPEPLTGRVARFLRDAWLSGMLPSLLVLPLTAGATWAPAPPDLLLQRVGGPAPQLANAAARALLRGVHRCPVRLSRVPAGPSALAAGLESVAADAVGAEQFGDLGAGWLLGVG
jgi:hypothetical protein